MAQNDIFLYVHENKDQKEDICFLLKEKFALVKEVIVKHVGYEKKVLVVSAYKPFFLVNESEVLVESGFIVPQLYYDKAALEQLYTINTKATYSHNCIKASMDWLEQNADSIYQDFSLELYDPTLIILNDKNDTAFKVLCNQQNKISSTLIQQCFSLKDSLKKTVMLKKEQQWVADVRFDNQIVFYRIRGAL